MGCLFYKELSGERPGYVLARRIWAFFSKMLAARVCLGQEFSILADLPSSLRESSLWNLQISQIHPAVLASFLCGKVLKAVCRATSHPAYTALLLTSLWANQSLAFVFTAFSLAATMPGWAYWHPPLRITCYWTVLSIFLTVPVISVHCLSNPFSGPVIKNY